MTILVTGGTGFVGSHIALALAEREEVIAADWQPWDVDNPAALHAERAGLAFAELDVRDAVAVESLIAERRVRQIVHAAAITVQDSADGAADTVAVNLVGAINLLNAALKVPTIERILLVSSSGVYAARASDVALDEESPLTSDSLYAITKVSAEHLAARYAELSGKAMASVRLPAVYGPFERSRASRRRTSVMRRLMDALVEGRPLRVAGPDLARDWTYAPEIGAAVSSLLATRTWEWPVYNISNGRRITLREAVQALERHGLQASWVEDAAEADIAMRPQDARVPLATNRLEQAIGFRPTLDINAGIAAWLRSEPLA